ncbi:hypothetical protein QQ25_04895 [Mycolicibacterium setense]|nr:hypothetical protein QQ25_04895 [Mycolicibacterium setense]
MAAATAGVIAITPVAAPTPTPPRIVDASASLMADFTGMNQLGLAFLSGQRLADQFLQVPLTPFVLAAQIAAGDNERLFSQIRQIVDSPLYVADPLIEAIAITVPREFGGGSDHITNITTGDGAFMQFRNNELLGLRDAINGQFADALGVDTPWPNANYTAMLAAGLTESATRGMNGAVLGAVGVVAIAQAIVEGDNEALYTAVRSYTDAPLWVADPTIEGLALALPESLGGGTDGVFTEQGPEDGALMRFRNEKLWTATRDTRVNIAHALGVNVNANGDVIEEADTSARGVTSRVATLNAAASPEADSPKVDKLKPHVTSLNTSINKSLDGAKDRAEQRRDKVKANVNRAVTRVQTAAKNLTKKVTPKESPKAAQKAASKGSED